MPPSPASVCSSTHEEFWRQVDYLSPISTPDVTFGEDNAVPQVFKEISSNLNGMELSLSYIKRVNVLIVNSVLSEIGKRVCSLFLDRMITLLIMNDIYYSIEYL